MQQNGGRECGFEGEKVGLKEKLLGKGLWRDIAGENFHIQKAWSVFKTIMSSKHFFKLLPLTFVASFSPITGLLDAALDISQILPLIFISTIIFFI